MTHRRRKARALVDLTCNGALSIIDMFRVALVGYGYWGKKIFKAASSEDSGIVISCVVDESDEALSECPDGCGRYSSLCEALENGGEMDAVVISTPIDTHYELVLECLRRGLDVFVEKPVCINRVQLDVIEYMANVHGARVYCDYTIAVSDKIATLKSIVGDEKMLHIDFRWESSPRVSNDNVVYDLFPHIISVASALSPGDISLKDAQTVTSGGAIVKVVAIMTVGGVPASATASWLDPRKVRSVKIMTETRVIEYDDSRDVVHVTPYSITASGGSVVHERKFPEEMSVVNHVEPLVKSLRSFVLGDSSESNSSLTRSVIEAFESIVKK